MGTCSARPEIATLFRQWLVLNENGTPTSAEILCASAPELLEPLRQEIEHYQADPGQHTVSFDPQSTGNHRAFDQSDLPTIPGYTVHRRLGTGGNGTVYEVTDELGRKLALKMLHSFQIHSGGLERFRREAEAMAHLQHPNIAPIIEWNRNPTTPFFTMPYFEKGSLAEHLSEFQKDTRKAVTLGVKVANAVAFLHDEEKIHRDLKPHNIFLDEADEPHVGDFGLVKQLGTFSSDVTKTGSIHGTPAYMSPEQAAGEKHITPQTDLWSLGVILYELLVGERPFSGADAHDVIRKVLQTRPAPPTERKPTLDIGLERIILKCLEKDPAARYFSAKLIAEDLTRWLNQQPVPDRRDGIGKRILRKVARSPLIVAGLAATIFAAVLAVVLWPRPDDPDRPLKEMQADLAKGKRIEFLVTGLARWHRNVTGEETHIRKHRDGSMIIESLGRGMVEIMPDPMTDHYRVKVKVRHDYWNNPASRVGLYLAHSQTQGEGDTHTFLEFSLAEDDEDLRETAVPPIRDPQRLTSGWCAWQIQSQRVPIHWHRLIGQADFPTEVPPEGSEEPWRELEVQVSGDFGQARLDGKLVSRFRWSATPQRSDAGLVKFQPFLPDSLYSRRGGIGLSVTAGSASFRDGSIEPIQP